jgi:hypothetical protein
MLLPPNKDTPLQQGDIIQDVPFLILPKAFSIKAQGQTGQSRLDSQNLQSVEKVKQQCGDKQLAAVDVPLALQFGMIVTQSCDMDHKDHITLARIYPINSRIQQARDAIEHSEPLVLHDVIQGLVERSDSNHLVYVGLPCGDVPQVADLLRLQSFAQDWKEFFRQRRVMSLTAEGLRYLQGRLSTFTGRYASEDGFWHTAKDGENARLLKNDRAALKQAKDRLLQKKGAKPN